MHTKKLHFRKSRNGYHLKDGESVLAALDLHNSHASSATAKVDDKRWNFKRAKILKRDIHISQEDGSEQPSLFCSDWKCTGILNLNGKQYFWGPVNKLWTHWNWRDESGKEIIRVKTKPSFLDIEGEVYGGNDLTEKDNKYLALVGWYMLLLHTQDPDALVFTGIESSIKKFKEMVSK